MRIAKLSVAAVAVIACATAGVAALARPRHVLPASPSGDLVVGLCDGETSVAVKGVRPGSTLTRGQAQSVSDELMAQWKAKDPRVAQQWDADERLAQATPQPHAQAAGRAPGGTPPASAAAAPPATNAAGGGVPAGHERAQDGHTYGSFTDRDQALWRASTDAFVQQGNAIFHDAAQLGGTIGVSCDMCHPNAANTHPETYPKYQVQLGRVALLRDMINWCIENPVRGKPLADDDPKMKAMEAFILAQRKGIALDYGKH
jgi:thiosulfate dehydrogenase